MCTFNFDIYSRSFWEFVVKQELLTKLAWDCQDFLCYMSDVETYELYYINQALKNAFGFTSDDDYKGKLCYKVLQHKDEPCEFCNNSKLVEGEKIIWEIQNPVAGGRFSLVDTLVNCEGRKVRVELAFDISKHHEEVESLSQKLSIEATLVRCVQTLMENSEIDEAITSLLAIVGEFYSSESAFLYEIDYIEKTAYNTYTWFNPNFPIPYETNEKIPLEEVQFILDAFETQGEISISSVEEEIEKNSLFYQLLKRQNVHSLMIVPIYTNNKVVGFIGVDNLIRKEKVFSLLHSVAVFAHDDLVKRRLKDQLEYLSYTDSLTGVENRNKFNMMIDEVEANPPKTLGIVYIDVNGLKKINEHYGHHYGDYILKTIASEVSLHLPENIYRIAGDVFIALCPNAKQDEFNATIAKLRKAGAENKEYSFSVGSEWQSKKIDVLRGITNSDEIMYTEKQNYYKTIVNNEVPHRTNAVEIVLYELRQGYFSLYLQPKVELTSGKIVEAEALVRKRNERGELVRPDKFIPIYEHDGTINHVDFFILEQVCILLQKLIRVGKELKISINFSRVTFMQYDLVEKVIEIASKYNIPHELLQIEITESIDKMDLEFFSKKLLAIQEAGFGISLDDFGACYSNLVMLLVNHFSEIKIDKSLIDNITTSAENRVVIKHLIEMVHQIGAATCIVEGIETEEQREILIEYGCPHGQGYLFYRPLAQDDFIKEYEKNLEMHKV